MKTIKLSTYVGNFAENKDIARALRYKAILPLIAARKELQIDFDGVDIATQSFMHALISEAVRKYGEASLSYIEFKNCTSPIKSIIRNVVGYSLEFASGETSSKIDHINNDDIPQADKLTNIRNVISRLSIATCLDDLVNLTGISKRHIQYNLNAARILNLISPTTGVLTEKGHQLLTTESGSESERKIWIEQIEEAKFYQLIVPDLFEIPAPSIKAIATRIMKVTGLSENTSHRRASTISSWRNQVGSTQQLVLDFDF